MQVCCMGSAGMFMQMMAEKLLAATGRTHLSIDQPAGGRKGSTSWTRCSSLVPFGQALSAPPVRRWLR